MILAYSVASDAAIRIPDYIKSISRPGMRCFYQIVERAPAQADLHEHAMRFFEINRRIFAQADILEFRFPTLLAGEQDLGEFLQKNEAQLVAELARLAGTVQIDVRVLPEGVRVLPPGGSRAVSTGTQYLRARREKMVMHEQLVRKILETAGPDLVESLESPAQLFLRVPRAQASAVMERLADIPQTLAAGPFPPSGFAKLLS
jgi:hypothetical protein